MLRRIAIVVVVLLLLGLAVQGFLPAIESYYAMRVQKVGGRPYVLLEFYSSSAEQPWSFSVYTPSGKGLEGWEAVIKDRLGPATGMFPVPAWERGRPARNDDQSTSEAGGGQDARAPSDELGIFHERRATLIDLNKHTTSAQTLPFDWSAETAVELNGVVYAFGVNTTAQDEKILEGELRAAEFDGKRWLEVPADKLAVKTSGKGFLLLSEVLDGKAVVVWRGYEDDRALGLEIEGPGRVAANGPLMLAVFDGKNFSGPPVSIKDLPRGNLSMGVWADSVGLKALIQTRKSLEDTLTGGGALEIWSLHLDGTASKVETIPGSEGKAGLLPFIAAERFTWQDQDYILRSNWQCFELWRKPRDGSWRVVPGHPAGLPVFELENIMLSSLALSLAFIAFGAGLAYRRRKQVWSVAEVLQPRDLYAPLGMRVGAYAVDLLLIFIATYLLARCLGGEYTNPDRIFSSIMTMTEAPYAPFIGIYIGYLILAEWLAGATLGKYLMGLRVVMDGGRRATFWAVLVRNLVGLYERLPLMMVVAVPMITFSPRRQRLGDILSRTFVVQKGALAVLKAQRASELLKNKDAEKEPRMKADERRGGR